MNRSSSLRWVLLALVACVAAAAGGLILGRGRAGDDEPGRGRQARGVDPAVAARAEAGRALREALALLAEGKPQEAEAALAQVERSDPGNGYTSVFRFAARVLQQDYAGAEQTLDAALAEKRWTQYTDAARLPGRAEIDRELQALRDAETGYRMALLTGAAPAGSKGLVRLRELGLRLAAVEPPDMVHLRVGATFRCQASAELVTLAKQQKDPAMIARFEKQLAADKTWQDKLDAELLRFVRGRPGFEVEPTESLWVARVTGEEQLVRDLVAGAPK